MEWLTEGEKDRVVAFTRTLGSRRMLVAANLSDKTVHAFGQTLPPWGYTIMPH